MVRRVTLKSAAGVAIGFWMLCIALWPKDAERFGEPVGGGTSREGLYKQALTDANFGMLGFQLFETVQGRKRWNIKAAFAEMFREENFVLMKQVDAQFFAAKTGNRVTSVSDRGRSYVETSQVDLEGNVSVQSARGYLFEMDKMRYDGTQNEFRSKSYVQMRGPDVSDPRMFLQGRVFYAHIDTEHFLLEKQVRGRRRLKTNDWLEVTSRSGEFFADEQRALFIGDSRADLPLTKIVSDIFEISILQEREVLHARGNVTLTYKDKVGKGDQAFLEVGSDRIILEGDARMIVKNDTISGNRIVLYTNDDRVQVQEAEGKFERETTGRKPN